MSLTNFDKQVVEDIEFVRSILPESYKVSESAKLGSIHCVSPIGIRKHPYVTRSGRLIEDAEDKHEWGVFFIKIENHFGDRFQEVDHNVCYLHTDFTIYLKK